MPKPDPRLLDFAYRLGLTRQRVGELAELVEVLITERLGDGSTLPPPPDDRAVFAGTGTHETAAFRFEDLGLIGLGGMGEVRRVRDPALGRTLALKVVRRELQNRDDVLERFIEEAQATSQLSHPGIVPVHEFGQLPDGRHYFTMKEVRGRSLGRVIGEVHAASGDGAWGTAGSWSFRRLVEAFRRVCEAVAYAHERGVIHRDLKPENVMVGEHGEVLVMDWGLARILGQASSAEVQAVHTQRSLSGQQTRMGQVAGTPIYMAPEQAGGRVDLLDARTDVYALGCILYEILSGRPPYAGRTGREVLDKVRAGPPPPPGPLEPWPPGPPLPEALLVACERAMAREQRMRFAHAGELATAIGDWLEGAASRERALAVLSRAQSLAPRAAELDQRAEALRWEAAEKLREVPPWAEVEEKRSGWRLQDEARKLEEEADQLRVESRQLLHAAFTAAPDLPAAHAALAALHREDHQAAEDGADRRGARRAEALLKAHTQSLPPAHPERALHERYLEGEGQLSLHTDGETEVLVYRYRKRDRRLVPAYQGSLGTTPIRRAPMRRGSYLLLLRASGRAEVRYPVHIGREEHWDGVPPGSTEARPIALPAGVHPGCVLVPGGWFWSGGDPHADGSLPRRRIWVEPFVMQRRCVTHDEWLLFLDALAKLGEPVDRYVPRTWRDGGAGEPVYARTIGGWTLPLGARVRGEDPVTCIDWPAAERYAAWRSSQDGTAWRLPGELEWEKAARGVDGRAFPWGDFLDPGWCVMRDSHEDTAGPAPAGQTPSDASPYGVRDLAGNVAEWCSDAFSPLGPTLMGARYVPPRGVDDLDFDPDAPRVARGGHWLAAERRCRVASRRGHPPGYRSTRLGLRLVASVG